MDELIRRAMAAYFRAGNTGQPGQGSEVRDIEGRRYAVLRDADGVLAVYRLTSQGKLRVLRRWPREVKEGM